MCKLTSCVKMDIKNLKRCKRISKIMKKTEKLVNNHLIPRINKVKFKENRVRPLVPHNTLCNRSSLLDISFISEFSNRRFRIQKKKKNHKKFHLESDISVRCLRVGVL